MTFGERLRELRTQAGLTHQELAEKAGLTNVAIYCIERGSSTPLWTTVRKIAKALRVPSSAFDECLLPRGARGSK